MPGQEHTHGNIWGCFAFSLFLGPQSPVHTHKIGQESQTVISLFPACTSAPVLRRPSRGSLDAHAEGACGADVACPIPSPGGCLYAGHHPAVPLRAAGPGWNLPAHLMLDPHRTTEWDGRDGGRTPQDVLWVSLSLWWAGFPSHPQRHFGLNTVGFTHGHKTTPWGTPVPAKHPQFITSRAGTRMGHTPASSPPFLVK